MNPRGWHPDFTHAVQFGVRAANRFRHVVCHKSAEYPINLRPCPDFEPAGKGVLGMTSCYEVLMPSDVTFSIDQLTN